MFSGVRRSFFVGEVLDHGLNWFSLLGIFLGWETGVGVRVFFWDQEE